jgi:hypothetical protein
MVTALINASNPQSMRPINFGGQILTALVLAGGSSGINTMLVGLGFRQVSPPATQPKPPPNRAWVSVRALRNEQTTGNIDILMGPMITLANGTQEPPFVGTIRGKSGLGFLSFFMLDRGRFPNYGGHEVDLNQDIYVVPRGNPNANPPQLASWAPHRPGPGAIIDLELPV